MYAQKLMRVLRDGPSTRCARSVPPQDERANSSARPEEPASLSNRRLEGSQKLVVRRRRGFLLHPLSDFSEVAGVAEVLVDTRESYVGDVVEGLETGHDGLADPRRGDLVAQRFHLPL